MESANCVRAALAHAIVVLQQATAADLSGELDEAVCLYATALTLVDALFSALPQSLLPILQAHRDAVRNRLVELQSAGPGFVDTALKAKLLSSTTFPGTFSSNKTLSPGAAHSLNPSEIGGALRFPTFSFPFEPQLWAPVQRQRLVAFRSRLQPSIRAWSESQPHSMTPRSKMLDGDDSRSPAALTEQFEKLSIVSFLEGKADEETLLRFSRGSSEPRPSANSVKGRTHECEAVRDARSSIAAALNEEAQKDSTRGEGNVFPKAVSCGNEATWSADGARTLSADSSNADHRPEARKEASLLRGGLWPFALMTALSHALQREAAVGPQLQLTRGVFFWTEGGAGSGGGWVVAHVGAKTRLWREVGAAFERFSDTAGGKWSLASGAPQHHDENTRADRRGKTLLDTALVGALSNLYANLSQVILEYETEVGGVSRVGAQGASGGKEDPKQKGVGRRMAALWKRSRTALRSWRGIRQEADYHAYLTFAATALEYGAIFARVAIFASGCSDGNCVIAELLRVAWLLHRGVISTFLVDAEELMRQALEKSRVAAAKLLPVKITVED